MVDLTVIRRHWLFALSVALFAACLFFQSFYYADYPLDKSYGNGWGALVMGWLGLLVGVPAWLANPLLIAAWVAYVRGMHRLSRILVLVAGGFMLSFTLETEIELGTSGSYRAITSYGVGYYLWLSSAVAQLIAASFPPQVISSQEKRGA